MLATTLRHLALGLLLAACSRVDVLLVDGLRGGLTEGEAISRLKVAPGAVHVVFQTFLPKGDPRPPNSEREIAASANCLGQASEVHLSFINNQLMQVTCYSQNPGAAVQALVKDGRLKKPDKEFDVTEGGTRIQGENEYDKRWRVTFTSVSLSNKQRDWVSKYS